VVIALLVWAVLVEPGRVVAREIRVPLARWPDGLGPLRIAAIADVHAGAPPIHGIIGGHFIEPEPVAMVLGRLRAQLGVFAVTGNHDWWYDGPRVTAALEAAGIRVLDDAAAPLPPVGPRLWIAGVGDLWTRPADVRRALAAVPAEAPVVVITHNPDLFPGVPARVLLTLAGHTHGGQVDLPLLGRLIVPSRYGARYAIGHVREDGRDLFVTPGLGTSILPVRFRVPPEISVLTVGR
jgi:uncharacterized protein